MIPYKIHHIWLQGEFPDEYRENYNRWDAFLIDWEHKVWSEEDLLELCTDEQVGEYSKVESLINRVNFLKYILLYEEGGIYADLDSYPIKDIYSFLVEDEVQEINLTSRMMSERYPYNEGIPNKPFGEYDVIIPGRNTLSYYPDGRRTVLLDNPVLMSHQKDLFWIDLIRWCWERENLKEGLPHEPFGPYGMSDFLIHNFKNPFKEGVLILPPTYMMGDPNNITDKTYIIHLANRGW